MTARVSPEPSGTGGVARERFPWPENCGPYCRGFDLISGTCSHHWTEVDQIVERVTSAFKRDVAAILRSDR